MPAVPEESRRLLSTGEAARHIGVDRSTLGRWVAAGIVKPTRRTMGGQYRWDLDELEGQMRDHFHEVRAEQRDAAQEADDEG